MPEEVKEKELTEEEKAKLAEEAKIAFEEQYTAKKKADYIAEQTAKNPGFVFDENTWPKPVWSDTVEMPAPKNTKSRTMRPMFPKHMMGGSPGSIFPRIIAVAIAAAICILVIGPRL